MGIRASYLMTGGIMTLLGLALARFLTGLLGPLAVSAVAFLIGAVAFLLKAALVLMAVLLVVFLVRRRRRRRAAAEG